MPLQRMIFDVLLDNPDHPDAEPVEHQVEVRATDQMAAEKYMAQRGVTSKQGITTSYVWVWCALARLDLFPGTFTEFDKACVILQPAGTVDVDPTQPGTSDESD